jgi:hypothetical protein
VSIRTGEEKKIEGRRKSENFGNSQSPPFKPQVLLDHHAR